MYIISSILLAFSSSLDNLIIGIAYGIKNIRISLLSNIVISLIVTLGTFLSMCLGKILNNFIPISITKYLGGSLLICIGLWMVYDYIKKNKKKIIRKDKSNIIKPLSTENNIYYDNYKEHSDIIESLDYDEIIINDKTADADGSGNIEIKEAITLAFALSINNFALGLGASLSGISITITTLCTFIFSIIILIIGLKIGNSFSSKFWGKYSSVLSAIIIIAMGVFQLL